MKIRVSKIYTFDITKERQRIKESFTGEVLKRQLNILEAFAEGNIELVITLYNDLPYNDEDECSEQEYLGMEISNFLSDLHYERFEKIDTILNENRLFVRPPTIQIEA